MTSGNEPLDIGTAVDKVADGVWAIRVPVPNSPIRYVLTYVFEHDGGHLVVDPGWHADESLETLDQGLRWIGGGLEDVRGVVVTHGHPDHYGLAGVVRRVSGAWVAMHEADAAELRTGLDQVERLLDENMHWLLESGAPDDALRAVLMATPVIVENVFFPLPDRKLVDGDRIEVDGGVLQVHHTPGHTPGSICLLDDQRRLLLTGDHVLPRITPNVGLHPLTGPQPLAEYLRSLERLRPLDIDHVLPGHEWVFEGMERRIDEILEHHDERMQEALAIVASGVDTAWGMAERLTWSRSFSSLSQPMKRAALSEALAHLQQLEDEGLVASQGDRPRRWTIREGARPGHG